MTKQIEQIDDIIKDFKTLKGVQGAVIVSGDKALLDTDPMEDLDENATMDLTSDMNEFIQRINNYLHWDKVEQMWLQNGDDYFVAARSTSEKFLLVKARNVPLGKLLRAIEQTVEKLNVALDPALKAQSLPALKAEPLPAPKAEPLPAPEAESNPEAFRELYFEPDEDDEIIYRHNPLDP